ncbi:hypothetical protein RSSM_04756 [Rhodopirellula sallentina SM41]|uniref:Uncharacterized protein n=1 Tax=Rhodopirellula sallentina SM41 TaxID=1263870 RepID=M5TXS5_9BACT|nr:hypothetical protein RSSM_04756 [Rhodopirellula sallentina SM41]
MGLPTNAISTNGPFDQWVYRRPGASAILEISPQSNHTLSHRQHESIATRPGPA